MKAKAGECHILNPHCRIEGTQNQSESSFVLRDDAGIASGFEKFAQSLMGEAANHAASV